MIEQRLVYLYVDNVQVGTLFTSWRLERVLARLRKYNPKAQTLEVTVEMKDIPINIRPGASHLSSVRWQKP